MSCDEQGGTWERIEFVARSEAYEYADCLAGRRAEVLESTDSRRLHFESHFFQSVRHDLKVKRVSEHKTASTWRSRMPEHVPSLVRLEKTTNLVDRSVSFSQGELRF